MTMKQNRQFASAVVFLIVVIAGGWWYFKSNRISVDGPCSEAQFNNLAATAEGKLVVCQNQTQQWKSAPTK